MRLPVIKVFHRLDLKGMPPLARGAFFVPTVLAVGTVPTHSTPDPVCFSVIVQLCNCAIVQFENQKCIHLNILLY